MERNTYADGAPILDDNSKVWAIDFDGTLVEDRWPEIGEPKEDMINHFRRLRKAGDRVILWTCREGKLLEDAVSFCKEHGLEFDAVNNNLPDEIRRFGNDCRKVGADYYVDDKSIVIAQNSEKSRLSLARLIRALADTPEIRTAFVKSIESAIDDFYCCLPFCDTHELAQAIFDRVFDSP